MPLTIGSKDVTDIQVGTTPVQSVHAGAVEVWRRAYAWEQAGLSKTITAPTWARYVDIVALGGGGSGSGGSGAVPDMGDGGDAGAFTSQSLPVTPGQSVTITVGQGGAQVGKETNGKRGGDTTVTTGATTITAAGGAGGSGYKGGDGGSPGSTTFTPTIGSVTESATLTGGGTAGTDTDGQWPGGGGGPGSGGIFGAGKAGRAGASGIVWYRFRAY